MKRRKTMPCVDCDNLVEDNQPYPYYGHKKSCKLVLYWRKKYKSVIKESKDLIKNKGKINLTK